MISVITGDIIKSRLRKNPETWLNKLKDALQFLSSSPSQWDIYRGDSFQIELSNVADSFTAALYIKASLKTVKELDVRMAIGIGHKSYSGKTVVESNGEAFQFSGETLEMLKKEKSNLKIKTANPLWDQEINLYFRWALTVMDHWSVNSAEVVKLQLEHPKALQEELGQMLHINQNAVSARLKRARMDLIMELDEMFRQKIKQIGS